MPHKKEIFTYQHEKSRFFYERLFSIIELILPDYHQKNDIQEK